MTPAELARARELHAAMVDGSAREDDVAELLRLLPTVFEAAERPAEDVIEREAEIYLKATRGIRRYLTPNQALSHAYGSGVGRDYSEKRR